MTKAGETDPDKELQKAFAEFRQSLRHDPQAAHDDAAPKLAAPEIIVSEPRRPMAQQPKVDTRPVLGASAPMADADAPFEATRRQAPEETRRRNLLYLSAAIVVSGLATLGWTLSHGAGPEASVNQPATAAMAPDKPSANAPATAENPPAPASVEATAAEAGQNAPVPAAQAPATTPADQTGAPAATPAALEKAAIAPSDTKEMQSPPTPPASIAPTPAQAEASAANAKKSAAPAQAAAGAVVNPRSAAKPKVAKAKPKPTTARNASRPPSASRSPGAPPEPVVDTVAAPPPAAPSNDGALGFVKRTVNSVGSTINNLGRGAIGN